MFEPFNKIDSFLNYSDMNKLKDGLRVLSIAALALLLTQCRPDKNVEPSADLKTPYELSNEINVEWNELYLDIERFAFYHPVVAARYVAYLNLVGYESIVPGMSDKYNSVASNQYGLDMPEIENGKKYSWALSMNSAYKKAFELFLPSAPPAQKAGIDRLYASVLEEYGQGVNDAIIKRSEEYGEVVAQVIYDWSKTDIVGYKAYAQKFDPNYVPPTGEGLWTPTRPDYMPASYPHWGDVRPFAAQPADFVIAPPVDFSTDTSSLFFIQALECYNLAHGAKVDPESEDWWIAQFWSDECPYMTYSASGRWIAITTQIIEKEDLNLTESAVAYAKVSMGLCDAGIGAWGNKYKYNLVRPITYITNVMGAVDWKTNMCGDGYGNYFTPSFPAYPSGHATFSRTTANILTAIFGENYEFTDRSHEGRTEFNGTPRTFDSFIDAANETAYSRLPMGVHYEMDAVGGKHLGDQIAASVLDIQFKK